MIEVGCNYSPELMNLIENERVNVDWIKLSKEHQYYEQFKAVNSMRPVLIHFVPGVMTNTYPVNWDKQSLNEAISESSSPHIALHLRAIESEVKNCEMDSELEQVILHQLANKKNDINRRILIENMPITCLPDKCRSMADPVFIDKVCTISNVGICLDIAHARISAYYRKEAIEDYLCALPLDRVEEIHISSPRMINGEFRDEHEELLELDYELLKHVLCKSSPKVVTLEYGGEGIDYQGRSDKSKIEDQLNKINEILSQIDQ